MDTNFYQKLAETGLNGESLERDVALKVLQSEKIEILPLIDAAFKVRRKFKGKTVTIHIINNGQNGLCPEDCHYCAQAKSSKADIIPYPLKSDDEFLKEAKTAYQSGAFRYCMVFAGRGPSWERVEHLAKLIRRIKAQVPLEICVSAGLLDEEKAKILKNAGLDRLNHNLNTSESHYKEICSTHTFSDRINTLRSAQKAGLKLCSGIIVGMKESLEDIVDVAYKLNEMKVASIPVNFLIPISGNVLSGDPKLSPEFCLRVLCLFRFTNPKAEIRIAAGREFHLRNMEVLSLYPANSLFLDGYLNAKGETRLETLQMIKDAGFEIESAFPIEEILLKEKKSLHRPIENSSQKILIKGLQELRPAGHP